MAKPAVVLRVQRRVRPRSRRMTAVWFLRSPGNYCQRRAKMDKQTVVLVQESWAKVVPISATAGAMFYTNLFEAAPNLKALFKGDMEAQATKLMQMITAAVGKLNELDALVPILQQLGKRHSGYGVLPGHYTVVGASLLKTLEQGLGPAFTPATKEAWTAVYGVMAQVMTEAAAS
jgi:hemoglobin-like flavoprotein